MIRTILALGSGKTAQTVANALTSRGIEIRYHCQSGAEIIRAVNKMGGGIILCSFRLKDMTADQLADTLGSQARILVLDKGTELDLCQNGDIFKMASPLRLSELMGAVTMLLQMDAMLAAQTVPKRDHQADALITRAKDLLAAKKGMSEPQAHRYLQHESMNHGVSMPETAQKIIASLS
ncbi:MAG: ANTAR domain-containing protein [Peptococcaceae bacterium]|nr:ANTAR domain-containing protein [Peptococcaceae bacterium]